MTNASFGFADALRKLVPWWLSDRPGQGAGKTAGFRFLWAHAIMLDTITSALIQGIEAAWPGKGTATALAFIGRTRGILRGQDETDDEYAARLRNWWALHREAGSQEALAIALHTYLSGGPRVRVVNRSGKWVTCDTDGTITVQQADGSTVYAFDWDSVSNPDRATHWWDQWVIIYPTNWATTGTWGDGRTWGPSTGLGHVVTRQEVDAVTGQLTQWKSEHTHIRAVIWAYDGAQFDPTDAGSLPNGNWGQWHINTAGVCTPSDRDTVNCRYWEPRL